MADAIFGNAVPGGRSPLTFPHSTDQLPPFADYSMAGRTYRVHDRVEWPDPFGFGLSYTRFVYTGLELLSTQRRSGAETQREGSGKAEAVNVTAGELLTVDVTVTNVGDRGW